MPVTVNGFELSDADMEKELPNHDDASDPMQRAMTALVIRRVLLDEAARLNITGSDDEEIIDNLLAQEVKTLKPNEEECQRYYLQNSDKFSVGELVEADHILFQVTPNVDLAALRQKAQTTLDQLLAAPAQTTLFAEMAISLSNCPSGQVGGSLGQLSRGDCVAEFEAVIFKQTAGTLYPRLLETRFGLHIVRVVRHVPGNLLPFDTVKPRIQQALAIATQDVAWRQYLQRLIGEAKIEGIALEGMTAEQGSPLVQ
jgi:peptidyl-prolyl cis-trans isomerase C